MWHWLPSRAPSALRCSIGRTNRGTGFQRSPPWAQPPISDSGICSTTSPWTRKPAAAKKDKPTTDKPASRRASKKPTPPAASVAAAQKVLRTVERRESALRKSLDQQTKTLKKVKKSLAAHRTTVKDLATDLKKVKKTRKSVTSAL